MTTPRPSFRKPKAMQAYDSPEELFGKLPNRAQSHGYLRGPQVDALRDYIMLPVETANVAMELPTGTGKTTVGLLIAEWCRRRSGKRVAYLTLTNQLAGQVLIEAEKLGLNCADLRGKKANRRATEVGRYQGAQAIGITTYSNLFNVNPVIQTSDLLIFDDAHGGEHFVSDMWTVHIDAKQHEELYNESLTILRPTLSDTQYQVITDQTQYGTVELSDIHGHPEIISSLISLVDGADYPSIHFPWSLIRNNLNSCLVFVSQGAITIRPIVPPTHTHEPFAGSRQKIYMSATLGGDGDLLRSYGVASIKTIRAQHPQWGKRYIFTPGLYLEDDETEKLVAGIWNGLDIHRALLLAPSSGIVTRAITSLVSIMEPPPTVLTAQNIEDSLTVFTEQDNTILSLAGRYDGLDLPGDDCRLLLLVESPSAVGALERHQREHWKLGPLLRRRERTRLIQGMGRCTRDATDFAVIILLGQSLINSITNSDVAQGLPGEIQRELNWGATQCEVAQESLKEMILGLLNDPDYRKEANEDLEETDVPAVTLTVETYETSAKREVLFSQAFWENNFSEAYEISRAATDELSGPELGGYCAWWFYLGSITAHILNDARAEIDCLKRARAIGINSGFIDRLLRKRTASEPSGETADVNDIQAEAIWNMIEQLGWHGPKFGNTTKDMIEGVSTPSKPTQFHIGLELLGKCLGAETIRSTDDGAPDVVWIFVGQCFTLEAKSDKKTNGRISKKEVLQSKGHPDWLIAKRPELAGSYILAVIVSPTSSVDELALPYVGGLNYVSTDAINEFSESVKVSLTKIRAEFAGKEYSAVRGMFKTRLDQSGLLLESIIGNLSTPLLGE
jgi:hypothetical protein